MSLIMHTCDAMLPCGAMWCHVMMFVAMTVMSLCVLCESLALLVMSKFLFRLLNILLEMKWCTKCCILLIYFV